MTEGCRCPAGATALGLYVLDALSPQEALAADAHLAACEACMAELAELAVVPLLLAAVSPGEAARITGPGAGPGGHGPRRAAGLAAGACFAVATAAAAIGLLAVLPGRAAPAAGQAPAASAGAPSGSWLTASAAPGPVGATVMYRAMGWGTLAEARVTGIPRGTRCELVILTSAGQVPAGGWTTDAAEGTAWYPASAGLPAGDVRGFAVLSGTRVLATVPTGRPV